MEDTTKVSATQTDDTQKVEITNDPSQEKPKRSEKEIAEFNLKKRADEARAQGLDPAEVLGIKPEIRIDPESPDDEPLTIGKLREIQKQEATATAFTLAESLPEDEREEVKEALKRVVPSGDAQQDLRFARAAVNAEHNAKIAEMLSFKGEARRTAPGSSMNANQEEVFEPTEQEARFMKAYGLKKEDILKARAQNEKE